MKELKKFIILNYNTPIKYIHVKFLAKVTIIKTFETTGVIFLPKSVDKSKLKKIQKLDVELSFVDGDPVEVETAARNYAKENNLKFISPYNDVNIIRGQGTCGVEILDQCRNGLTSLIISC